MLVILTVGCIVALTANNVLSSSHQPLKGYQMWKLSELSQYVLKALRAMEMDGHIDLMNPVTGRIIAVAPNHIKDVTCFLEDHKVIIEVAVQDLGDRDEEDKKSNSQGQSCTATICPAPLTDDYMTFQQMEYYLDHISQAFSDRVTVTSIGKSHENRDIWMVHIKSGGCNTNRKLDKSCRTPHQKPKAIWLEGGIHACEWISPSVALQMIDGFLNDCATTRLYDVYVAPCINPDGYEYSRTTHRLQRKNRSHNSGSSCRGVDLNRNWGYEWGDLGSNQNPCSKFYKGESAFSEPETMALRDAMKKIKDLELFLSFHSYSQVLLLPWAWTTNETIINSLPDKEDMERLADVFVDNINAHHGSDYHHVITSTGFYPATGISQDWAKGSLGVKYSYTLELPPNPNKRDFGWLLSRFYILPTGQEVWYGLKKMLAAMNPSGQGSKRCMKPTISCILHGGSCIRKDEDCNGTLYPKGCKGRCCTCCIPDNKCKGSERCMKPTISCTLHGGSCIRKDEDCDGTLYPKGCTGRCCTCCIPENKCKGCNKSSIACTMAGGSCIGRNEYCNGIIYPKGCKGRCCACCVP